MYNCYTVVSGRPYRVLAANGRSTPALSDLAGSGWFTVERDDAEHRVQGEGTLLDDVVRFHEKSEGGDGKDLRVWTVGYVDGLLTATP